MTAGTHRERVGFAGMGRMGVPMARNIAAAGFPLTVYNRTRERCAPLASEGAAVADSPADLGRDNDIVITMLSDSEAVREVLVGSHGAADPDGSRGIVIEMSTIGPGVAGELAREVGERGWSWVDAPVSGSVALAERATLTTMVGADPDALERATPVLEAMTRARHHVGGPGTGAAMKLALNLLIASSTQAVSEALVLAERAGIERSSAYDVIADSAAASPFIDYKRAAFLDPGSQPVGFSLTLMQRDLDLALALARDGGVPLLAAAAAREGMTIAAGLLGGDEDLVRVADGLRAIAGGETKEERG